MSLYDNEENAIVNNDNDVSETPSNLVNNNLGLETSQEELDKKLQYKRDGNVNESKLSPNPAGFGFIKQLFVTPENTATNGEPNLPGEPNVLYLVQVINDGVLIGFRKYKWTPSDGFVQFGATPDLKLKDGPRETPTRVENEPKRTPARVFDGDVAIIGDLFVKGQKVQGSADPLTPSEVVDIVNEGIEGGDIEVGTEVVANPTLAGTESALTGLQVGDDKFAIKSGGKAHAYLLQLYGQSPDNYHAKCVYFTDNDNLKGTTSAATKTNLTNDLIANGHTSQQNYCYAIPVDEFRTSDFSIHNVSALWVSSTTLKSVTNIVVPSIDTSGETPVLKASVSSNSNVTVNSVTSCIKIY